MKDTTAELAAKMTPGEGLQPALDLLALAQITEDYCDLVRSLAGPLHDQVVRVFPGHLQLIYLVTDTRRRQVWNAVFASPRARLHLAAGETGTSALRERLLTSKSKDLLRSAYGNIPPSFVSMLGRLGTVACEGEIYVLLRDLAAAVACPLKSGPP